MTPKDKAPGLLVAHVALDKRLSSPENGANTTPTSRVPEARPLWCPTTSCP